MQRPLPIKAGSRELNNPSKKPISEGHHSRPKLLSKFEQLDPYVMDLIVSFLDAQGILSLRGLTLGHQRYVDNSVPGIIKRMTQEVDTSWRDGQYKTEIEQELACWRDTKKAASYYHISERAIPLRCLANIGCILTIKEALQRCFRETSVCAIDDNLKGLDRATFLRYWKAVEKPSSDRSFCLYFRELRHLCAAFDDRMSNMVETEFDGEGCVGRKELRQFLMENPSPFIDWNRWTAQYSSLSVRAQIMPGYSPGRSYV